MLEPAHKDFDPETANLRQTTDYNPDSAIYRRFEVDFTCP
jgi:hypothetical protein